MKIEMELRTLGDVLLYHMRQRRVKASEVAKDIGCSESTIFNIVNGHDGFRASVVLPIAKWCKLTPQELWDLLDDDEGED